MGKDVHFNSVLFKKLSLLVEQKDYVGLTAFLDDLSNSQYRTAGYVLGERIGVSLQPDSFWKLFIVLVRYDSKAFLVTMLKSFIEGMEQGRFSLYDQGFNDAAMELKSSPIDAQKTVQTLIPVLEQVQSVRHLFTVLGYDEMSSWIPFLLKSFNKVTAFILLQSLHYVEQDRAFLLRVGYFIISRGDSFTFNVASLIKSIYGLEELKGTFSLRLQPFELSRIEKSYEAFCSVVDFH